MSRPWTFWASTSSGVLMVGYKSLQSLLNAPPLSQVSRVQKKSAILEFHHLYYLAMAPLSNGLLRGLPTIPVKGMERSFKKRFLVAILFGFKLWNISRPNTYHLPPLCCLFSPPELSWVLITQPDGRFVYLSCQEARHSLTVWCAFSSLPCQVHAVLKKSQ